MAEYPPSYEMTSPIAPKQPVPEHLFTTSHSGHEQSTGYEGPAAFGTEETQFGAPPTRAAYDQQTSVWHTGQSTTVVVNQPGPGQSLRPGRVHHITDSTPTSTVCFNCGQAVVTYIYHEVGTCTYVTCVLLACIGCDMGCCLIPFCLDYFKDATHKCPNCHMVLGKHKKI